MTKLINIYFCKWNEEKWQGYITVYQGDLIVFSGFTKGLFEQQWAEGVFQAKGSVYTGSLINKKLDIFEEVQESHIVTYEWPYGLNVTVPAKFLYWNLNP